MEIVIWICWNWIEGKIYVIFCNKFYYVVGFFINCLLWVWLGNKVYYICNEMGIGDI